MDEATQNALANDLVIDITTTGRTSGEARRIEIWIHEVGGRHYITGSPGTRGWYANLLKNPSLTVHVKKSHTADLSGTATPITDPEAKRSILRAASSLTTYVTDETVVDWLARSPLVEVVFD
jgi:deazaflavin-dependent oxidoreductase (nitroreductase family)